MACRWASDTSNLRVTVWIPVALFYCPVECPPRLTHQIPIVGIARWVVTKGHSPDGPPLEAQDKLKAASAAFSVANTFIFLQ